MNFYYENSNGRKIDLNEPPFLGVKSNNLWSFKWDYITQGQAVQKIVKFEKAMVERNFQVVISGIDEARYLGNLELFLQLTEADINNVKMGKLWLDDYYLEGYIIASTKPRKYLNTTMTIVELTVVSEKGNWQSEESYHFRIGRNSPDEQEEYTGYGIYYPYEYNYDYAAPFDSSTIVNEAYLDTDFEIRFYGAYNRPEIRIGGNLYKINYDMDADDYIVINSKYKTAILTHYDGSQENMFQYRERKWNLFEKIKSGGNLIIKPDDLAVDVTLFYERSEPKWTEAKWT